MTSFGLEFFIRDATFHRRYRIVRFINAGSMGAVYDVLDVATGRRRALKVMNPSLVADPEMRDRFEREAKVTGDIESDHLVQALDAGVDESTGTPFIVMDLLRGEELGTMLRRRGRIPKEEVIVYLYQASLALDKAHKASIVHRDLKPENMFITRRDDGSPCLKILDFGIAKVVEESNQTRVTRPMGTPVYMSPEQGRSNGAIGPAADIYALAQIAYALLVGEPYWIEDSKSMIPLLLSIDRGVIEPPVERAERHARVTLPEGFDPWFVKATALRPEDRFERATAAILALAEVLSVAIPKPASAAPEPEPPESKETEEGDERSSLPYDPTVPVEPSDRHRDTITRETPADPMAPTQRSSTLAPKAPRISIHAGVAPTEALAMLPTQTDMTGTGSATEPTAIRPKRRLVSIALRTTAITFVLLSLFALVAHRVWTAASLAKAGAETPILSVESDVVARPASQSASAPLEPPSPVGPTRPLPAAPPMPSAAPTRKWTPSSGPLRSPSKQLPREELNW